MLMLATTTSRFPWNRPSAYRPHTSYHYYPPRSSKLPANPAAPAAGARAGATALAAFLLGAGLQVLAVPALRAGAGASPDVHRQRGRPLLGAAAAARAAEAREHAGVHHAVAAAGARAAAHAGLAVEDVEPAGRAAAAAARGHAKLAVRRLLLLKRRHGRVRVHHGGPRRHQRLRAHHLPRLRRHVPRARLHHQVGRVLRISDMPSEFGAMLISLTKKARVLGPQGPSRRASVPVTTVPSVAADYRRWQPGT
jgi:hypothetical protein